MTAAANRVLNPKKYGQLLARALPKAIETEKENERALEIVDELMSKGEKSLTVEESALLKLLVGLIEKFEEDGVTGSAATTAVAVATVDDPAKSAIVTLGENEPAVA